MKLFFVMLLLFPILCNAKLIVHVPILPGLFETDGSGKFDKMLKNIDNTVDMDWKLNYTPFFRAVTLFKNSTSDCIIIGNKKLSKQHFKIDAIDAGVPYNFVKLAFYTLNDSSLISHTGDLKDKTIVHLTGESPLEFGFSDENTVFLGVNTHQQSIKMLELNRAQSILGTTSSLYAYKDQLKYDPNFIVFKTMETLTCKDTKKTRKALEKFKEGLILIDHDVNDTLIW